LGFDCGKVLTRPNHYQGDCDLTGIDENISKKLIL